MSDLNIEGMALADGVVETILAIAVRDVDGVAQVGGSASGGGLLGALRKGNTQGIEVTTNEDGTLAVDVRIEVSYGHVLPEVADAVRTAVADAALTQVGLEVASVNVSIDGIKFE